MVKPAGDESIRMANGGTGGYAFALLPVCRLSALVGSPFCHSCRRSALPVLTFLPFSALPALPFYQCQIRRAIRPRRFPRWLYAFRMLLRAAGFPKVEAVIPIQGAPRPAAALPLAAACPIYTVIRR